MKSMIQLALIGGLLFGAAFAASYFLFQPKPEAKEEIENLTADANSSEDTPPAMPPDAATAEKTELLPIAFRNTDSINHETIIEMNNSITKKEKALEDRERLMSKDELRMKQMQGDLDRERSELKAFSDQLEQKMMEAAKILEEIKIENAGLAAQKQELEALKKKMPADRTADKDAMAERVAPIKKLIESLDPSLAAKLITDLANNGELEFAANILNSVPAKQGSKILAELGDSPLATQLIEALSNKK